MDWLNISDQLQTLEKLNIDYLHFDLMDGVFVPEFSLGPLIIKKIQECTNIPSDYHLMVEEPRRMFEQFFSGNGAYFSIHYEACRNLHRELVTLKKLNFNPGIVLNPATTLENIEYIIDEVSKVTIMTVNPGYVGQKMVSQTLNKVKKLNEWRNKFGFDLKIAVDGNVSFENVPNMVAAGADILVVGTSGLFVKNQNLEESYKLLISKVDEGLLMKE
tara:strand:- start:686 stop:1336 length:651 start_codon:yes stop_codon:yes gene_type:complete